MDSARIEKDLTGTCDILEEEGGREGSGLGVVDCGDVS